VLWLSFVCERGNRTYSEKTAFFSLFFISPKWHRQSPFPSRKKEKLETHPTSAFKKICRNTRVDSHSHAHALKTFTSSRPRKKKRERERGTFHSRARSFLSRREVEFPPLYISRVLKIGTLLACLPFLIKNPPRRTQVTQRRKNASTNTHIFKTRMAKYYPDIAKGAKGNRFQTRFLLYYFVPCFALFSVQTKARSLILLRREDLDVVSHRSFSHHFLLKNRFIHRRFVLRKQILPGRETNLRRGTFFISLSLVFIRSRERLAAFFAFESSSGREIETSKDFCSGASLFEKALMRKNEQNERFLTRARFLSLSTCDEHTHTHT
jgi:hypothetical protein